MPNVVFSVMFVPFEMVKSLKLAFEEKIDSSGDSHSWMTVEDAWMTSHYWQESAAWEEVADPDPDPDPDCDQDQSGWQVKGWMLNQDGPQAWSGVG